MSLDESRWVVGLIWTFLLFSWICFKLRFSRSTHLDRVIRCSSIDTVMHSWWTMIIRSKSLSKNLLGENREVREPPSWPSPARTRPAYRLEHIDVSSTAMPACAPHLKLARRALFKRNGGFESRCLKKPPLPVFNSFRFNLTNFINSQLNKKKFTKPNTPSPRRSSTGWESFTCTSPSFHLTDHQAVLESLLESMESMLWSPGSRTWIVAV